MFEYIMQKMSKKVIERSKIFHYMNLDDEPGINEKIKKKKNNKTKTRNENHSLLNSNKVTHTNYLPKYLSITNNLLG